MAAQGGRYVNGEVISLTIVVNEMSYPPSHVTCNLRGRLINEFNRMLDRSETLAGDTHIIYI